MTEIDRLRYRLVDILLWPPGNPGRDDGPEAWAAG